VTASLDRHIAALKPGGHLCALYETRDEQLAVAAPFLAHGLATGARCVFMTPGLLPDEITDAVLAIDPGLDVGESRGALQALSPRDRVGDRGAFDAEEMLARLVRSEQQALADGFSGLRILIDLTPSGEAMVDTRPLIEFEARLQSFPPGGRSAVLCQYDRTRLPPAVLHDVLRTNPVIVVGDLACDNPYYEPPDLLLEPSAEARAEHTRARVEWWLSRLTKAVRVDREHAKLEQQFFQAQKMEVVGRLAGGVAHDFNNLLCVILSYAEMIDDELAPDAPVRADVKEIRTAGVRARDLVRQLLAFSRQQVFDAKILDLNEVVVGAEKMLRRLLGEDIELTTVLAPGLWHVRADPGQVEQIVLNLAVNARDAMPDGGRLTVTSANVELESAHARSLGDVAPGPYVSLSVADSGVGMDPATLSRIFEPFFTTKEQGQGTGLGLASVFGIVKQSRGHIEVASEPGKGATFTLYFPRVSGAADRETDAASDLDARGGDETVLLVEDDDQVRAVARGILRNRGYVVLEASNPGEALLIVEQHQGTIHLLLSDVVMPRMNGRQLAERLATARPEMRVLFMSGYTGDASMQESIASSGTPFLQKPFTPASLARKVREALHGRRSR